MARRLFLRVIAPPLNHAHLIDLLKGWEHSGFFDADPLTARSNELAIRRAGNPFAETDVFQDGPLAGRRIRDHSLRLQTLALAPSIEVLPGEGVVIETQAFADLVGRPLVVSATLRRTIIDEYHAGDLPTDDIEPFLALHHGLAAVLGGE